MLIRHLGIRVLRGITTDTGPFSQISVRRIVDYAKAGVRLGANPYIGRLNNARVRAALKATLDGFLSQMVLDEMLIVVRARRERHARPGDRRHLRRHHDPQPTFSIDFIRVTMNLE